MIRWSGSIRATSGGLARLAIMAALIACAASTSNAQIEWQGASGGNWDVGTNWNPNTPGGPNGAGVTVANGTANTILLNSGGFTVDSFSSTGSADFELFGGSLGWSGSGAGTFSLTGQLVLQGGSTLSGFQVSAGGGVLNQGTTTLDGVNFAGGTNFTGISSTTTNINGTITNTGNFQINDSSGQNTFLTLGSATTFAGGGTVTLSSASNGSNGNTFLQGNGQTLTNNSTIQGNGVIGNGSLALVNNGTIDANVSSGGILLLNGGAITNTGTMEASGGGVLNLQGVAINNSGGNIATITSADTVQLFGGTTIEGGSLTGVSGSFLGSAGTVTLDGSTGSGSVTINGTYTGASNTNTNIVGTIQLNGNLLVTDNAGQNTFLTLGGGTTLQGGGTVTLFSASNGSNGNTFLQGNGQTLTNNATIQGNGVIGNGSLALINNGVVNANVSGGILTMNGGPITNSDLMLASNGGVLNIDGVTINNAGGNITANTAGDTVQLFGGTTIQGGALNSTGGGFLGSAGSATLDGSTASGAVTINGTYTADSSTTTTIVGTIVNNGNIQINENAGQNTFLSIGGPTLLAGDGTVTLSSGSNGTNGNPFIQGNGEALTNSSTSTIQGNGVIGNGSLMLINNGTVDANVSSGGVLLLNGGAVTNTNLMEASGGGILDLKGITVINGGGNITADNLGDTVQLNGGTIIQGGTLNNTGGGFLGVASNSVFGGGLNITLDGSSLGAITINGVYTGTTNTTTTAIGTIDNNGNIQLNSNSGNNTSLTIGSGGLTIQGGTVSLATGGNLSNGTVFIEGNGQTLTNDGTIQGNGTIGHGSLALINNGTVDANVAGGGILLLNTSGGITNTNLMEASNGGILQLDGVGVNNANGNITAASAADTVEFFGGTTIQGGTLNNVNVGFLGTPAGNVATLDGNAQGPITINGTYTGQTSSNTTAIGTIDNNGNIQLNSNSGNNTTLTIGSGGLTLQGGTVTMSTGGNLSDGSVFIQGNSQTLINNGTIQGNGTIGNGSLTLINNGIVNANTAGGGILLLNGSPITNTNLMEANGGGVLQLNGVGVNNQGGNITAGTATDTVEFFGGTTIQGGTLNNLNGGFLGTPGSSTANLDGNTVGAVTINGTYTGQTSSTTNLTGTIEDNGNIQIDSNSGNNTFLTITGATTLQGPGTVTLSTGGNLSDGSVFIQGNSETLTNDVTIQGNGTIGNGSMVLTNNGTVLSNVAGGGILLLNGGPVTNNGTLEVDPGSNLHVTATLTNWNGGTSTLTGGTYISNGTVSDTGTLQINSLGTTGGEIVNNAATIVVNGPNSNIVDADGLDALNQMATNTGSLTIEGGRTLTTSMNGTNTFSNSGSVFIGVGSNMLLAGTNPNFTQSAGITTVNGTLGNNDPMSFDLNSGILNGTGTVIGNVLGTGGSIEPGLPGSTGELTISGNLDDEGSALDIRLGGTGAGDWDQLDVTGGVTLGAGSVLDVSLFDGFTPTNGETFTFLDFSALTSLGSPNFFGTDNGLTTPGGVFSIVELGGDNLTLTFTANAPPPPPPSNGTPEPAPMVMLASGALVWVLLRRKSRGRVHD